MDNFKGFTRCSSINKIKPRYFFFFLEPHKKYKPNLRGYKVKKD